MSKPLIKDRSYHLKVRQLPLISKNKSSSLLSIFFPFSLSQKTYKQCFKGTGLVSYLVDHKICKTRAEAQTVGCVLLMFGVIRHCVGDHHFKDEDLFFRFLVDEKPSLYRGDSPKFQSVARRALHIYSLMHLNDGLIQDRGYGIRTFKQCFIAQIFIEWAVEQGLATDAADAINLGQSAHKSPRSFACAE